MVLPSGAPSLNEKRSLIAVQELCIHCRGEATGPIFIAPRSTHADPGHRELAMLDRDLASLPEQLIGGRARARMSVLMPLSTPIDAGSGADSDLGPLLLVMSSPMLAVPITSPVPAAQHRIAPANEPSAARALKDLVLGCHLRQVGEERE
jgi:hypothetical protein